MPIVTFERAKADEKKASEHMNAPNGAGRRRKPNLLPREIALESRVSGPQVRPASATRLLTSNF